MARVFELPAPQTRLPRPTWVRQDRAASPSGTEPPKARWGLHTGRHTPPASVQIMPVMPICKGSVLRTPTELYAMLQEGGQLRIQSRGNYSSKEKAVFDAPDPAEQNRCIATLAGRRRECDFLVCHTSYHGPKFWELPCVFPKLHALL